MKKKGIILNLLSWTLLATILLTSFPAFTVSASESKNLLINGGGEDGMTGWTDPDDIWEPSLNTTNHEPKEGETFFWPSKRACTYAMMYQDVAVGSYKAGTWMKLSAWLANYNQSPHDQATLQLSFLNASGEVLSSDSSQQRNPEWGFHEISLMIPEGALTARVSCIANRFVGSDNDAYFDDICLVTTTETINEVIITGDKEKVRPGDTVQLSATDGKYTNASDYEWSSSYDSIATVDENGLVTISTDADFAGQEVWIYAKNRYTGVIGKYYINSDKENNPEPEPSPVPSPTPSPEPSPTPSPEPEYDESAPVVTATVSVKLKWKRIPGAKGYFVYMYDDSTDTYDQIAKLSKGKASYQVDDLELGQSYKFMVRSFKKVKGKTVLSGDSNIITLDL